MDAELPRAVRSRKVLIVDTAVASSANDVATAARSPHPPTDAKASTPPSQSAQVGSGRKARGSSVKPQPPPSTVSMSSDRSLLDQRLFYTSAKSPAASPGGGMSQSSNVVLPSPTSEASAGSSGYASCKSLSTSWSSYQSADSLQTFTDTYTQLFSDATPEAASSSSVVAAPDGLILSYVRMLRDFYRTGARYDRRNVPPPSHDALGLETSFSLRFSTRLSQSGRSSSTRSAFSSSSLALPGDENSIDVKSSVTNEATVSLRAKILTIQDDLKKMRELKRRGSTAEIFADVGDMLATTIEISPSEPNSEQTSPSRRRSTKSKSVLELLLQSQAAKMQSESSPSASLKDGADVSIDAVPDSKLVDRFTGANLEALMAVTVKLSATLHTRYADVQRLCLAGCGIGDDGCFVVLHAIRFGPLRRVQCLDLMYNQLTLTSAFYMGVLLLLRPPAALVNVKANQELRALHEEVPKQESVSDARTRALHSIALRLASQQRAGSAADRQAPAFFFPPTDSSKSIVSAFFNSRSAKSQLFGSTLSDSVAPANEGVMSRFRGLRNTVKTIMSFGGFSSSPHTEDTSSRKPMPNPRTTKAGAPRVVDEHSWMQEEHDEEDEEVETEPESEMEVDEELRDSLDELESIVGAKGRRVPEFDESYIAGGGDRNTSASLRSLPTSVQLQIKQLQEKEQSNAATDVVSLRLGWNDLEDDGMAMLSEWLACQTFLTELSVCYNDISADGFAHLKDALRSTTSLVSLNTEGNSIDDPTAEALRGTLLYNRRLLSRSRKDEEATSV